MSEWLALGPHRYRIEDDILHWSPNGEVLSQHATGVCMLFDKLAERYGYMLWLVDARRSIPIGPETRRVYARWFEKQTTCSMAVASFGASVPAKTTASLILRAVWLINGIAVQMECFPDESDARAYLASHRDSMRAAVV